MKVYIKNLWKGKKSLKHIVMLVLTFNIIRIMALPIIAILGDSENKIETTYWLFNLAIFPIFIITHKALSEICAKSSLATTLLMFSSLSYFVEITMVYKLFD